MYQIRSCGLDCENLSHCGKNGRNLKRDKFGELGGKGSKQSQNAHVEEISNTHVNCCAIVLR